MGREMLKTAAEQPGAGQRIVAWLARQMPTRSFHLAGLGTLKELAAVFP